jgi:DNA helicase-2/ATP-dependent DNA helicase PcrA
VAITRARERLTFTGAKFRMMNGELRNMKTSRFLKEVPLNLLEMDEIQEKSRTASAAGIGLKTGIAPSGRPSRIRAVGGAKVAAKKPENIYSSYANTMKGSQMEKGKIDYAVGDRVKHIKFGEGKVLDIKDKGKDFEVTVEFDAAGVRKMYAAFARLVKI